MNWRTIIVASSVVAIAAAAAARSTPRQVIVVALAGDPRAADQQALLQHDAAALRERDIVVETITPAEARQRSGLGVAAHTSFELLLVGRDGSVKLRRDAPLAASEITALIDTMPMRQAEMRR